MESFDSINGVVDEIENPLQVANSSAKAAGKKILIIVMYIVELIVS